MSKVKHEVVKTPFERSLEFSKNWINRNGEHPNKHVCLHSGNASYDINTGKWCYINESDRNFAYEYILASDSKFFSIVLWH